MVKFKVLSGYYVNVEERNFVLEDSYSQHSEILGSL